MLARRLALKEFSGYLEEEAKQRRQIAEVHPAKTRKEAARQTGRRGRLTSPKSSTLELPDPEKLKQKGSASDGALVGTSLALERGYLRDPEKLRDPAQIRPVAVLREALAHAVRAAKNPRI